VDTDDLLNISNRLKRKQELIRNLDEDIIEEIGDGET
jgi:hypothetical protein